MTATEILPCSKNPGRSHHWIFNTIMLTVTRTCKPCITVYVNQVHSQSLTLECSLMHEGPFCSVLPGLAYVSLSAPALLLCAQHTKNKIIAHVNESMAQGNSTY